LGLKAVELVQAKDFGHMAALRATEIISVPIEEALGEKPLDPKIFADAAVFFG
jgi:ATP-dependent phosphofructokinase / diphosphate-dependent phosphofructokinase